MGLILLGVLVVMIASGRPRFKYSEIWGNGPAGVLGLVLVVAAALLAAGFLTRSL